MSLSQRALAFLQKSERENLPVTRQDIYNAFEANNVPSYQPLIDFQINYGGCIFYAGLASIKYTILFGLGNNTLYTAPGGINVIESEFESPKYYFTCAATNYQMTFSLDEEGVYYEDYDAIASSFDKFVEHLALWDEMECKGDYKVIHRDKKLATKELDKLLNVKLVPEASDQYTLWFSNELLYLRLAR